MLELRHKLELNAKVGKRELTKNYALALHTLFDQFHKERTLWLFGTDSFFATARTTGFREHAVQGFVESQSNTVGTYDPQYGTGIYDSTASFLGLSNFELRAMMYTPGM